MDGKIHPRFFMAIGKNKMSHYVLTATEFMNMSSIFEFFRYMKRKSAHASAVRTTIKELSKLSDRELNDIGLSRGDIYWVAHSTHSDIDPTDTTNKNLKGWV